MNSIFFTLLVMTLLFGKLHAFTIVHSRHQSRFSTSAFKAVEVMTLDDLQDHEAEGKRLSASVAGWLDLEWMPQEIHIQIGERVKSSYIRARESGENEIMNIMTEVVDDLCANWKLYDKDAFVNAWDIGNYVSDYLHDRVGAESCGCNALIFNPDDQM
jgi:hypothetical protein